MTTIQGYTSQVYDPLKDLLLGQIDPAMSSLQGGIKRRSLLKLTGFAGLGFTLAFSLDLNAAEEVTTPPALNTFIRISSDGDIFIYAPNPEMGQGVKTAMPMIIAEELDADWSRVIIQQAPTGAQYGLQFSGGSRSIAVNWDALRQAGATARALLVAAAAKKWGVPASTLTTTAGKVSNGNGDVLGYGELAAIAAMLPLPAPDTVKFKERHNYRIVGTAIGGVDNLAVVLGAPLFGIDQRLPGMVYASYMRCPRFGGVVKSANLDEVKSQNGIKDAFVVEAKGSHADLVSGVAIVGNSTWSVLLARSTLHIEWDLTQASTASSTHFFQEAKALRQQAGDERVIDTGNVDTAFSQSTTVLESFYTYPFAAHASLEPMNCTAWLNEGKLEIWAPTQTPQLAVTAASTATGLPPSRIVVHATRIGGGFGRRLLNDYVAEAAAIALRVKAPVKLQWTREEDMMHDHFRPAGYHALKAAIDDGGQLAAWQHHLITFKYAGKLLPGAALRENEFPINNVPNYRLTQTALNSGTPYYAWRAPGANGFAWVFQSFLHELSIAANRDHRDFLIDVMGEPRWFDPGNPNALNTGRAIGVIKLAAEKAGWGKQMPEGRALGLAFHFCHAGHVAQVVDVSVDKQRRVRVHKVVVAADVGPVINTSGALGQIEGAVIDALSTMSGLEITLENGAVEQSNFDRYRPLRMPAIPAIEAHFIESDYPPTGLGEPGFPPLAPAVCNAIYSITGHRIRNLPITKEGFSV